MKPVSSAWRTLFAFVVTMTVITGALVGVSGSTAANPLLPISGPLFNDPTSPLVSQRDRIRNHVLQLIDGVPAKSVIRVALFGLNDRDVAAALVKAHRRGAVVRVILDHRNISGPSYRTLRLALGTKTTSRSWVKLCREGRGCHSTGINHNKFWLFSRTGAASEVVVQSSTNMSTGSYRNQWNTAHTFVASAASTAAQRTVYDAYRGYFESLTRGGSPRFAYSESFPDARTYFFPQRSSSSGDPIVRALDRVTCVDPTTGRRSAIRVAMFLWTRSALARKVMQKTRQGCDISIVYSKLSPVPWSILHPRTGARPTMSCYVALDRNNRPIEYVHSKYLLIDGIYQGRVRRLAMTGSANYTGPALSSNDEAIVQVDDGFAAYVANFTRLTHHAKPGTAEKASICQGQPFR